MKLSELYPEVSSIEIDGEEIPLRYNMRAMIELEKIYGSWANVEMMVRSAVERFSADDLVNMIHACLIGAGKKYRRADVDDLVAGSDRMQLTLLAIDNYYQAAPTGEQIEKLEIMAFGKPRSEGKEMDWGYIYAYCLSKGNQSDEWFLNATMRQIFTLMIGVSELDGAKTELDDAAEI